MNASKACRLWSHRVPATAAGCLRAGRPLPQDGAAAAQQDVVAEHEDEDDHRRHWGRPCLHHLHDCLLLRRQVSCSTAALCGLVSHWCTLHGAAAVTEGGQAYCQAFCAAITCTSMHKCMQHMAASRCEHSPVKVAPVKAHDCLWCGTRMHIAPGMVWQMHLQELHEALRDAWAWGSTAQRRRAVHDRLAADALSAAQWYPCTFTEFAGVLVVERMRCRGLGAKNCNERQCWDARQ